MKSVLADFGLTITIVKTTVNKQQVRHYKLGEINNVSEICLNRSKQGWKFEDPHKIFQAPETLKYQHLTIQKEEEDPFIDD